MITSRKTTAAFSARDSAGASGIETLLTPREAAALLNVSERTLWGLGNRGEIPVVRLGRATRYDPEDVRALIVARKSCGESVDNG